MINAKNRNPDSWELAFVVVSSYAVSSQCRARYTLGWGSRHQQRILHVVTNNFAFSRALKNVHLIIPNCRALLILV